jgi:hypothetical protein
MLSEHYRYPAESPLYLSMQPERERGGEKESRGRCQRKVAIDGSWQEICTNSGGNKP